MTGAASGAPTGPGAHTGVVALAGDVSNAEALTTEAVTPARGWRMSRGWAIVWTSFFTTAFVSGGSQYGFGLFVKPLEDEFGWSRTEINVSLSIGLISGLISPLIGMVIDKRGVRLLMTVSMVVVAAAFFMRVVMNDIWVWYASSALMAVGMPGTFLPTGKLIGAWFPHTRGRMMGTAITGNNVFGLVGAPLMTLVIAAQSWRLAYGIIGTGVLVTAVAVWLVVRDRPRPHEEEKPRRGTSQKRRAATEASYTLGQAVRTRTFWLMLAGVTCAGFSYPSFMTQLIPHMEAEGWTSSKAALALTVLAGTALCSKITWGWLSEKLTARVSFVIAIGLMSSGVALVTLAGGSGFVWPAIVYFGTGFGGIGPLMSLLVLETFGLKNFGSIQGVVSLVLSTVPVLVGPILAGRLFDATGSYETSFWIATGIFASGGALVALAQRPKEAPA